jgi:cytochrome c-type biogenesis protein
MNPGEIALAFGGGLASFISPCTLPLLPGYLSYISGLGADEIQQGTQRARLLTAATLFVLGFSFIFVALGATGSYLGSLIHPYHTALTRAAGGFILVMALIMIGMINAPFLQRERRFHPGNELGLWGAFPMGMAFGFGWVPCIGPILASIFGIAATESTAQKGALLLFVYALGLGLPFLVFALFADRFFGSLGWFRRHYRVINLVGGSILLVMGLFLILNRWTALLAPVMNWYADLNLPS